MRIWWYGLVVLSAYNLVVMIWLLRLVMNHQQCLRPLGGARTTPAHAQDWSHQFDNIWDSSPPDRNYRKLIEPACENDEIWSQRLWWSLMHKSGTEVCQWWPHHHCQPRGTGGDILQEISIFPFNQNLNSVTFLQWSLDGEDGLFSSSRLSSRSRLGTI